MHFSDEDAKLSCSVWKVPHDVTSCQSEIRLSVLPRYHIISHWIPLLGLTSFSILCLNSNPGSVPVPWLINHTSIDDYEFVTIKYLLKSQHLVLKKRYALLTEVLNGSCIL